MRSLETGRYLIRAANDGISAIVGPHGEVLARAPEYRPTVLRASVIPRRGLTPFAYTGNWLIISLAATTLAGLAAWVWLAERRRLHPTADVS
jgi:apolipoprotein N-acyltransferase